VLADGGGSDDVAIGFIALSPYGGDGSDGMFGNAVNSENQPAILQMLSAAQVDRQGLRHFLFTVYPYTRVASSFLALHAVPISAQPHHPP
jgi:hypothetical protein